MASVAHAMLDIGHLKDGLGGYYLSKVADGMEDYYAGEGEAPGEWAGELAAELGLRGEVSGEQLRAVLGAEHAEMKLSGRVGRVATESGSVPTRRPGFDLVFRAPKSWSLIYAFGDGETRRAVQEAHDRGVTAALALLEREALYSRKRTAQGRIAIRGEGALIAKFVHRSTRAGDPLLHTHALLANATRCEDGVWRRLDASHIYAMAKGLGAVYQAVGREWLYRELGLEHTVVRHGYADVSGVPETVIQSFSRRRRQILDWLDDHPYGRGAAAAHVAAHQTRSAKAEVPFAELQEGWEEHARVVGWGREEVRQLVGTRTARRPRAMEATAVERIVAELLSPRGLTAERSSFGYRDLLVEICNRLPQGGRLVEIQGIAQRVLASEQIVRLKATPQLRFASGLAQLHPTQQRYTTRELREAERAALGIALRGVGRGGPELQRVAIQAALAARPFLNAGQRELVRRVGLQPNRVMVVRGDAGSGKTTAMAAVREAAEASGVAIAGAAVARRAAAKLESAAGIPATSLAAFTAELREGSEHGLARRQIVVLDEASMIATRPLVEVLRHAERADARVVIVVDPRQLPELEAGGLSRGLLDRLDPVVLSETIRQRHDLDRAALALHREGRIAEALALYEGGERIHFAPTPGQTRQALVEAWAHEMDPRDVMMASTREAVRDLNLRARRLMSGRGQLGGPAIEVGGAEFQVGEVVVTRVPDYPNGIRNQDRWVIAALDAERRELSLAPIEGGAVRAVDAEYLQRSRDGIPALEHGYAGTIHITQGQDARNAYLLDEALNREASYTGLSRNVEQVHVYVTEPRAPEAAAWAPLESKPPAHRLDQTVEQMSRSEAQRSSFDQELRDQAAALPIRELYEHERQLASQLAVSEPRRTQRLQDQLRSELQRGEALLARADAQREALEAQPRPDRLALSHARATEQRLARQMEGLRRQEREAARRAQEQARAPEHARARAELSAARDVIAEQLQRRLTAARLTEPSYVSEALGPRPQVPGRRAEWERGLREIEAYRQRFGVNDPIRALGAPARQAEQRAEQQRVLQTLDGIGRSLGAHQRGISREPSGLEIAR